MCGIFGYVGKKDPLKTCVAGLERLEYRGYDSSGIAGVAGSKIASCKKIGKLSNLKKEIQLENLEVAIGHTRWATHGKVSDENAHPHFDANRSLAIVHNGILENYDVLREGLRSEGVVFSSETDTEVIAQLIAKHYKGDLLLAVQQTVSLMKGAYAFAVIHKNHPDTIIAVALECPLAVGIDDEKTEAIISSDPNAFIGSTLDVLFLHHNEIAKVQKGSVEVYSASGTLLQKTTERIVNEYKAPSKEGFDHYLIKEIFEQPNTIQKAFFGRFNDQTGRIEFESLRITPEELLAYKQVWIIGCGTSSHAGSIGAIYLEEIAHIPSFCEIASEARYRSQLIGSETLIIAISQSGETADTLAAIREMKVRGCKTLAICNVKNSTLAREADGLILLKAGPEISVCSSKALTSQVAVLYLFALYLAQLKGTSSQVIRSYITELKKVPFQIENVLQHAPQIEKMAKKYARFDDFFFMGRRYMFVTALEAALKLKEISYVNANGYPAGELKHGPIALLCDHFPVIAFCANKQTEEKIASSLMEVKARGAPLLAIAPEGMRGVESIADDLITVPPSIDPLAPFASTVVGQLLAYYIAKERGCDIDQPRNLAKSVTVE